MSAMIKLSEAQRVGGLLLRAYWDKFCDCEPVPDDFLEQMERIHLIRLRKVKKSDIADDPFAYERGIELGGMLWELTTAGRAALSHTERTENG